MGKRFLNIDPDGELLTTDKQRFEQRVLRGLQRPLLSLPYEPERGTRNHEMLDKQVRLAIANIMLYTRRYLKNYYPEIAQKYVKVKSLQPLAIEFELDIIEDTTT